MPWKLTWPSKAESRKTAARVQRFVADGMHKIVLVLAAG